METIIVKTLAGRYLSVCRCSWPGALCRLIMPLAACRAADDFAPTTPAPAPAPAPPGCIRPGDASGLGECSGLTDATYAGPPPPSTDPNIATAAGGANGDGGERRAADWGWEGGGGGGKAEGERSSGVTEETETSRRDAGGDISCF